MNQNKYYVFEADIIFDLNQMFDVTDRSCIVFLKEIVDEFLEGDIDLSGFYLGSIGGPAAILAKENILSVEVVDFAELGMEAVRKITIKDFPAFIITDDKGNDFFANL